MKSGRTHTLCMLADCASNARSFLEKPRFAFNFLATIAFALWLCSFAHADSYFVDAANGSDDDIGTSAEAAIVAMAAKLA